MRRGARVAVRRRASSTPASSNVSRIAATQKPSPPCSRPSCALAAASSTAVTSAQRLGAAVVGVHRATGEHVRAGDEHGA